MLNRRQFSGSMLSATASLMGAGALPASRASAQTENQRKKIAFLGTTVFRHSHAQHFLDRFSIGYAMGGRWVDPQFELASVYIEQFNDNDIGKQRIEKYSLQTFSSVKDALTLGGKDLAVDGVVIIGEHGDYPKNEKGQTLYPRYKWFKEIVSVFEQSGRSVPVFNDKHLSTDWNECLEMVADSRRLGFPFYAGSSLPVTWRLPSIDMPYDTPLSESVCVAYGGVDSYDFHALETAQCMSERRRGGEVGIRNCQALRDQDCWDAIASRDSTSRLVVSALCRSHNLPVENGYPTAPITLDWARGALPTITGYFIEHLDGFRTAVFMTGIRDFNYAGLRSDTDEIIGCQMMLPMPGSSATTADFFNPLTMQVEQMIDTGKTSYPIDRTLLTSGMVIAGVESLHKAGAIIETPTMAIAYKAPRESVLWQQ
jgi:hypothetical protein